MGDVHGFPVLLVIHARIVEVEAEAPVFEKAAHLAPLV